MCERRETDVEVMLSLKCDRLVDKTLTELKGSLSNSDQWLNKNGYDP